MIPNTKRNTFVYHKINSMTTHLALLRGVSGHNMIKWMRCKMLENMGF
jgi:hypothetical protein